MRRARELAIARSSRPRALRRTRSSAPGCPRLGPLFRRASIAATTSRSGGTGRSLAENLARATSRSAVIVIMVESSRKRCVVRGESMWSAGALWTCPRERPCPRRSSEKALNAVKSSWSALARGFAGAVCLGTRRPHGERLRDERGLHQGPGDAGAAKGAIHHVRHATHPKLVDR